MKKDYHEVYVGIDVHRRQHTVAIMPIALLHQSESAWKGAEFLTIINNRKDFELLDAIIRKHAANPREVAIAIDHTGGHYSEPIVYFLQKNGYHLCHLEPKGVKAARERLLDEESKSDSIDAASLAYLLYLRDVHGLSFRISAVTPELRSKASIMRCLVIQAQQYNKLATQTTNRLHQLLLAVFPEGEAQFSANLLRISIHYPTPQDILNSQNLRSVKYVSGARKKVIMELAAKTVGAPAEVYRDLITDLSRQRSEALAKREAITKLICREVATHPYGHVLLSLPCFGSIAAATVIGIVNDIHRWSSKKKLKKALGVYSTLKQSGTSPGKGRMGKEGSRHGRRVLFQVVLRCIRTTAPDNDFKDYYFRQVTGGKLKLKAIVSTMGKLAEVIYHCLSKEEVYSYQGKCSLRSKVNVADR